MQADVSEVSLKNQLQKINEKLLNQKYATLFLSWMPFISLVNFNSNWYLMQDHVASMKEPGASAKLLHNILTSWMYARTTDTQRLNP